MVKVTAKDSDRQGARHDDDRAAGERRDHLRGLPRLASGDRDQPGAAGGQARSRLGERPGSGEGLEEEHPAAARREAGAAMPTYTRALSAIGRCRPGLYAAALAGKPVLCAACHASNALPGTGIAGVSALTSALHANHGTVVDPTTHAQTLDSQHQPRGVLPLPPGLGDQVPARRHGQCDRRRRQCSHGLPELPRQHDQGRRSDARRLARAAELPGLPLQRQAHAHRGGRVRQSRSCVTDTRFATNPNMPAAGFSLFRFSKGHGGLQCEACHGSTHAEYPSSHANDNLQSIALQGYAGHDARVHGLPRHAAAVGDGRPARHAHDRRDVGRQARELRRVRRCRASARTATAATIAAARWPRSRRRGPSAPKSGSTRTYAAGQNVGCYDCHNGPNP